MQQRSLIPWYLGATLGTLAIVIGSLTAMKIARVEVDQSMLGIIGATVLPTLTALIAALRSEANGQQLEQVQQAALEAAARATTAKDIAVKNHQDLLANNLMTQQIRDTVVPPT